MQRLHALQRSFIVFVFQQGLHFSQCFLSARIGGQGEKEQQGKEKTGYSWHCLLGNIWGIEFGFGSMIIDKNHEKPVRPKYLITDVDNYFIENGFFLVFSLFCVGRAGTDRSLRGESTRRKLCFQARGLSDKASR